MRLNRLGAKLIAVFLFAGVAMLAAGIFAVSASTIGAFGGAVLLLMGGAYVIAIRARLRIRHNRWLAANGLRGSATIVAANTELSVNEQPLFELVLDLDLPGHVRRRVERKIIVGSFAARRIKPGILLPVRVHPRDPDDILVVW